MIPAPTVAYFTRVVVRPAGTLVEHRCSVCLRLIAARELVSHARRHVAPRVEQIAAASQMAVA